MKTVVLDGTPFLFPGAGVGRVTQTLVETMAQQLPGNLSLRLYARCLRGKTLRCPGLPMTRLRLPKSLEPAMAKVQLIERLVPGDLYHATDHYLPMNHPHNAVVTIHDLLFMIRPNPNFSIHAIQRRLVPPFVKACRHVIVISEQTKKDVMKHLLVPEEQITVIPWAVDETFFTPPEITGFMPGFLPVSEPYFLAVGCNTERKNTPRLLEAYCRSGARSPLVLAWNPPNDIREKYASNKSIHFIGRVTEEQLRDLYRSALALVYPSLYEGFGLPALEAMACGCPVITSNTTSLPEVGGDAVLYIDPENTDSIAHEMKALEESAELQDALQKKGYEQVKRFSWKKTAQATMNVYSQCLEEK
ncbi:glycosyltransferase family 1 protein [Pontiellaceae bacterium B12227]|nr:glycosyltransferase family 1 protein [Pontiellaceae bacterium B12227]